MIYDHCMQGAKSLLMTLAVDRRGKKRGGTDSGVNRYNHTLFICRYAYDEQVPLIRAERKYRTFWTRMHDHNTQTQH